MLAWLPGPGLTWPQSTSPHSHLLIISLEPSSIVQTGLCKALAMGEAFPSPCPLPSFHTPLHRLHTYLFNSHFLRKRPLPSCSPYQSGSSFFVSLLYPSSENNVPLLQSAGKSTTALQPNLPSTCFYKPSFMCTLPRSFVYVLSGCFLF